MSRPDRHTRISLRRALGRHDRWTHPILASLPRRKRWTQEEASALLSRLFDHLLRSLYLQPRLVEQLVYSESHLLAMMGGRV